MLHPPRIVTVVNLEKTSTESMAELVLREMDDPCSHVPQALLGTAVLHVMQRTLLQLAQIRISGIVHY